MTWRARIAEARTRGRFTRTDKDLSIPRETCGIGRALVEAGLPADWYWKISSPGSLGGHFCWLVLEDRMDAAEQTLGVIEDRVLQVKREMYG